MKIHEVNHIVSLFVGKAVDDESGTRKDDLDVGRRLCAEDEF
ncbi:hypothetical protein FHT86_006989 [Rhizobium sp. BK313]|nr:hypothetical protein [Rhizobium sp. BK313]MBB3458663.1 hypothetical protein [Rhizobium sp. BK313]